MLGLGPRCRRFESFRPDQKIQTVAFAAVLIFCLERTDSNDKILLSGSNVSLDLSQGVINLRGIRDNLPTFDTWQIYSLSLDLSQDVINLRVSSYLVELR